MIMMQVPRIGAWPPALGFAACHNSSEINPGEFRTHEAEEGKVGNILILLFVKKSNEQGEWYG